MKRTYARLDLNKTEFDIMCNHLGISLFGRNDLNNPLVKIILPKIKYKLHLVKKSFVYFDKVVV